MLKLKLCHKHFLEKHYYSSSQPIKTLHFLCGFKYIQINLVSFKQANSTQTLLQFLKLQNHFGDNIFEALKRRINCNSNILIFSVKHFYFNLITQESTCFFIICCISKTKQKHHNICDRDTQSAFTCSKLTVEILEQGVNMFKVKQQRHQNNPNGIVLVSLLLTLKIFHTIVNVEYVIAGWAVYQAQL